MTLTYWLQIIGGIAWGIVMLIPLVRAIRERNDLERTLGELQRGREALLDRAESADKSLDAERDRVTQRDEMLLKLREMAERAINEALEQKQRADRYFACIRGVESERDEWKRIAGENVALYAGGLEGCLFEIHRLSHVAKMEVGPVFQGIVDGYNKRRALAAELPPKLDEKTPLQEYEASVEHYVKRFDREREAKALGPGKAEPEVGPSEITGA